MQSNILLVQLFVKLSDGVYWIIYDKALKNDKHWPYLANKGNPI